MMKKRTRLNILKNFTTCAVLLFYLGTPMLDSMVCADCVGHAPFQGESTISHMKTAHIDVSYAQQDGESADSSADPDHKSFCSICANVLMGTEVSSINPPIIAMQCDPPHAITMISELHYSIDKPPQNFLV